MSEKNLHSLPPEPRGGQDDEPPDVLLAVRAVIRLFDDIDQRGGLDNDLLLRLLALRAALNRLRKHLERDDDDESERRVLRWLRALQNKR